MDNFTDFTRRASIPEHLEHYVRSLTPCTPLRIGSALGWRNGTNLVLVSYPLDMDTPTDRDRSATDQAVSEALALDWLEHVSVLSPFRPKAAPKRALCHEDAYWTVDLPVPAPRGKLANMLRRAAQAMDITVYDSWTREHDDLVALAAAHLAQKEEGRRPGPESGLLFGRIGNYADGTNSNVCCYSARRHDNGSLCGLAVADHSSYAASFYLFAFRAPDAPPGTADALLDALLTHSAALGQQHCNLGLGIHPGIHFFKKKWGAKPTLPLVECSWDRAPATFFSRLAGFFGKHD